MAMSRDVLDQIRWRFSEWTHPLADVPFRLGATPTLERRIWLLERLVPADQLAAFERLENMFLGQHDHSQLDEVSYAGVLASVEGILRSAVSLVKPCALPKLRYWNHIMNCGCQVGLLPFKENLARDAPPDYDAIHASLWHAQRDYKTARNAKAHTNPLETTGCSPIDACILVLLAVTTFGFERLTGIASLSDCRTGPLPHRTYRQEASFRVIDVPDGWPSVAGVHLARLDERTGHSLGVPRANNAVLDWCPAWTRDKDALRDVLDACGDRGGYVIRGWPGGLDDGVPLTALRRFADQQRKPVLVLCSPPERPPVRPMLANAGGDAWIDLGVWLGLNREPYVALVETADANDVLNVLRAAEACVPFGQPPRWWLDWDADALVEADGAGRAVGAEGTWLQRFPGAGRKGLFLRAANDTAAAIGGQLARQNFDAAVVVVSTSSLGLKAIARAIERPGRPIAILRASCDHAWTARNSTVLPALLGNANGSLGDANRERIEALAASEPARGPALAAACGDVSSLELLGLRLVARLDDGIGDAAAFRWLWQASARGKKVPEISEMVRSLQDAPQRARLAVRLSLAALRGGLGHRDAVALGSALCNHLGRSDRQAIAQLCADEPRLPSDIGAVRMACRAGAIGQVALEHLLHDWLAPEGDEQIEPPINPTAGDSLLWAAAWSSPPGSVALNRILQEQSLWQAFGFVNSPTMADDNLHQARLGMSK